MHRHQRIGLLGAAAATFVAPLAQAQQTPAPTPTPRPAAPILLPGAERFDLGRTPQPVRPTIAPVAAPTPVPSATPRVTPPVVRATPTPAPRPAATPTPTVRATPTPEARPMRVIPTPSASPTSAPAALPAPTPTEATTDVIAPPPAAQPSGLPWLWILLGLGAALAIGAVGWALGRRRRDEPEAEIPAPKPKPAPPPPPAPVPAAPRPAAQPAPAAPAPADPISVLFHPRYIEVTDKGAVLDFEMELVNTSGASADDLKIALLMVSANPGQDGVIAGFHAAPAVPLAGPPVDIPPGEGGRVPGKLMLEAERIHVVKVGERPMFVPIVMIDLRWRGGLTLRRHAADFMIGTAGHSGKLGPIWLDRGTQRQGGLASSRYFIRAVPEAAAWS